MFISRIIRSSAGGNSKITNNCTKLPYPNNEPVLSYAKGSAERNGVLKEIKNLRASKIDIPIVIGGKEIRNSNPMTVECPYDHSEIAVVHQATSSDVEQAIGSALEARREWARMPDASRQSVFNKAADLLSDMSWRCRLNAATILGQGKNMYQSELDAACELIDFWRFNSYYASHLEDMQPYSPAGVKNSLRFRPLEGFVYAVSPFNFTAIGGNLACAPAVLGNAVVWKPSQYSALSNYLTFKLLEEAGLPSGVINFVPGEPEMITRLVLQNRSLAGIHYTGSSTVFQKMYKSIGQNIEQYRSYPKIVGECGGKGFVFAHSSAAVEPLACALIRGAFEFSGQKCSAATRAYIPASLWPALKRALLQKMERVVVGSPEDAKTLVGPVIHRAAFERCKRHIQIAKASSEAEVVFGGDCNDSVGYFVQPTIIHAKSPTYQTLIEEIFGPVLVVYVYEDHKYVETLQICDQSAYALTGAIWATDPSALDTADEYLRDSCGNYYINDKPTGSVVGQQPFGGARISGTNNKAGSYLNLLCWASPRAIKENFEPPSEVLYPYMEE